jgi:hypothetical protein
MKKYKKNKKINDPNITSTSPKCAECWEQYHTTTRQDDWIPMFEVFKIATCKLFTLCKQMDLVRKAAYEGE